MLRKIRKKEEKTESIFKKHFLLYKDKGRTHVEETVGGGKKIKLNSMFKKQLSE